MELPPVSSLSPTEARATVQFAQGDDPTLYGQYYQRPFDFILDVAHRLPPTVRGKLPGSCALGASNWNEWLQGYSAWGVPEDVGEEGMMRHMKRTMNGESFYSSYSGNNLEKPQVQLRKFFAAPIERQLAEFSSTDLHQQLANKLFVLKIAVHPENSSTKRNAFDRCQDPAFKVWRLVTVRGDTNLDSFHDQIIGPAMGWRRHYHAYEFTIPTSGAVFGPVNSGAIDMVHASSEGDYMLNTEDYDVRHVLRKQGDRLGYLYDLGDGWRHIITVLDVVEKGAVLTAESFSADARIQATWKKQVSEDTFTVTGNHLLAGEINCPPEDSIECDRKGDYGSILKKGRKHVPSDRAVNWNENGIRTANDFDLSQHQIRFEEAINNRKNPIDGNLQFRHSMPGAANSSDTWAEFDTDERRKNRHAEALFPPGEPIPLPPIGSEPWKLDCDITYMTDGKLKTLKSAVAVETVERKKDKGRCAACGKQKGSNSSLELFDCSLCKTVAYCGRICQQQDWTTHRRECGSPSTTA
jgi:hypothetical protein